MVERLEELESLIVEPANISAEKIFGQIKVSKLRVPRNGHEFYYTTLLSPVDGVGVIAEHDNKIVLLREYRHAIEDIVIGMPTGAIKEEEKKDKEKAARREFEEETGYLLGDLKPLGSNYLACGTMNLKIHYFTGRVIGTGKIHHDLTEELEVVEYPFEELMEMLKRDELKSAALISGLMRYAIYKGKL